MTKRTDADLRGKAGETIFEALKVNSSLTDLDIHGEERKQWRERRGEKTSMMKKGMKMNRL